MKTYKKNGLLFLRRNIRLKQLKNYVHHSKSSMLLIEGEGKQFECYYSKCSEVFICFLEKYFKKTMSNDGTPKLIQKRKEESRGNFISKKKRKRSTLPISPVLSKSSLQISLKRITPEKMKYNDPYNNEETSLSQLSTSSRKVTPEKLKIDSFSEKTKSPFDQLYEDKKSTSIGKCEEKKQARIPTKDTLNESARDIIVKRRITAESNSLNAFFAKSIPNNSDKTTSVLGQTKQKINKVDRKVATRSSTSLDKFHGLKGFSNLGNTCYINSILQCLFNLKTFMSSLSVNSDVGKRFKDVMSSRNVQNFVPEGYNVKEQVIFSHHIEFFL